MVGNGHFGFPVRSAVEGGGGDFIDQLDESQLVNKNSASHC